MLLSVLAFGAFLRCRRARRRAGGLGLGRLRGFSTATRGGFAVAGGRGGGYRGRSVCGFAHNKYFVFVYWLQLDAVRNPFRKRHASPVLRAEKEGKALCCNRMQRRDKIAPGLR